MERIGIGRVELGRIEQPFHRIMFLREDHSPPYTDNVIPDEEGKEDGQATEEISLHGKSPGEVLR
jgi:hypothetical protein